ncbi:MAG: efflux RND transporter periplasmic adaptor subunit [Planctomycetes bacterium]|nr:efflux RND transporter periplasmic adaptor subunit [Planctomycetota bacterium]
MRRLIRWAIILGVLGLVGWGVSAQVAYWKDASKVTFREGEVVRGKIVAVVNSTGPVKPVQAVSVGSVVSGPIEAIFVDFNDEVKKGQLLARVDQRLYAAGVARDKAALATRKAEVDQARAKLQQAKNDEVRAKALRAENKTFISDTELDQFIFNRMSLEALVAVAETTVQQAKANLDTSEANLEYTLIKSPVDGIIIDRKIDPGQTMAAQFQTPELFIVAPDLRKEMHVFASVDETDIGLIRDAQQTGQPVRFTVDAYPDDLFEGKIFQIRKNSTTTQNVVTYPVVVTAPNPDLKLLPGMTASISFQVGKVSNVLKIPNAALRFYPQPKQVRPEDRKLLEGKTPAANDNDDQKEATRSAQEKAELRRQRNRRHLWILDGEFLRAVEVITGLNDSHYTELLSGDMQEGQKLVVGIQPRN